MESFKDIGEPIPKWNYDILINGEPSWMAYAFSAKGDKLRITMVPTSREKLPQLHSGTELTLRIYNEVGTPDAFYTDVSYVIKKFVGVDTDVDSRATDLGLPQFMELTYVYTYESCYVSTSPVKASSK